MHVKLSEAYWLVEEALENEAMQLIEKMKVMKFSHRDFRRRQSYTVISQYHSLAHPQYIINIQFPQ